MTFLGRGMESSQGTNTGSARMNRALTVFLTIDTKSSRSSGWPHVPLTQKQSCSRELNSYFWGGERDKRLGLPYQLEVFSRYGLKASFFVEPLFSFALGLEPLRSVVAVSAKPVKKLLSTFTRVAHGPSLSRTRLRSAGRSLVRIQRMNRRR